MTVPTFFADAAGNRFLIVVADVETGRRHVQALRLRPWVWTAIDNVLLLSPPIAAGQPTEFRIFEADGTESAMCGNGARAVAIVLDQLHLPPLLRVPDGSVLNLTITEGGDYRVPMGSVSVGDRLGDSCLSLITSDGSPVLSHWYDVLGEPHLVALVDDATAVPLDEWGGRVTPAANFTVASWVNHRRLFARTFERGVNRETLSCGTGAVAAAQHALSVSAPKQPLLEVEIDVLMRGGLLSVTIDGDVCHLTGPAQVVAIQSLRR
ncbi:Diaminopimelate epimerase [Gimesia chilikensis]|uniref:Diaminopimelate epimerase n=1 Tax=Gimesia chilikensis TaxID=2605989 RepID=A0A517WAY8_9PLAN|nr:hypothetical protein [Gimesia chilikensis]QDU02420.1 Diaminopimelate epimerase [Gimesia chilikensis]